MLNSFNSRWLPNNSRNLCQVREIQKEEGTEVFNLISNLKDKTNSLRFKENHLKISSLKLMLFLNKCNILNNLIRISSKTSINPR